MVGQGSTCGWWARVVDVDGGRGSYVWVMGAVEDDWIWMEGQSGLLGLDVDGGGSEWWTKAGGQWTEDMDSNCGPWLVFVGAGRGLVGAGRGLVGAGRGQVGVYVWL